MGDETKLNNETISNSSSGKKLPPAAMRAKNKAAENNSASPVDAEVKNEEKKVEELVMPVIDEPVNVSCPDPSEEPKVEEVEVKTASTTEETKEEKPEEKKKEKSKVKVKTTKKALTKEEKKHRKILKKGKRHYWWRYLMVFIAGIIFPFVAIAGALAYGSMVMTASQLVSLFGGNPEDIITQDYADKTVMELIMDIANGEITFNNLAGVRKITPLIDNVIYNINIELDKAIGFEFDIEELYQVNWENIGTYIYEELQSGIKLANVLGVNENSSSVLIYLAYNTNGDGEPDWDSPRSLGDLMNNMDSIINNARIGDLLDVGTSGILYNLRDVKVGEMATAMETRPLNQIIDIADDSFPALIYLGNFAVGELSNALDNATLEDLLPIDENSVLWGIKDKKINEVSEEIMHLKLGDVITITPESGAIMNYLKDTPLDHITDVVQTMPLEIAIEITEDSPIFLKTLRDKGANLSNMNEIINSLTLGDIIDIGSSRILAALANSSMDSLGEDVENLTLGDCYDVDDPNAPLILKTLRNVKISDLGNAIHDLKISEIIEVHEDSPMILKALADTKFEELEAKFQVLSIGDIFTEEEIEENVFLKAMGPGTYIETMADTMSDLTFVDVFADYIYEDPNADPLVVKSTWKYLLEDETGNINTSYKICYDMETLIENMERNFKEASLYELKEDGMIVIDDYILDKTIAGHRVGDLTMKEFIELATALL